MVEVGSRARKRPPRTTKTLAWRDTDEGVLRRLRARIAARFDVVMTERDLVAAALRVALSNPAALAPPRPVAR